MKSTHKTDRLFHTHAATRYAIDCLNYPKKYRQSNHHIDRLIQAMTRLNRKLGVRD